MYTDDLPPYADKDPDYAVLKDPDEIVVLRMLKTYEDLILRYTSKSPLVYNNFNGTDNFRKSRAYKPMCRLAGKIRTAKIADPAHFIAFIFELWATQPKQHERKFQMRKKGMGQFQGSGVDYPSLKYIVDCGDALLQEFAAITNYKPTHFMPRDDYANRDRQMIRNMVDRWCEMEGKTPADYWTTPQHLRDLEWKYIDYADSLWECDALIQEKFGFSVQEMKEYLIERERVTREYFETHPPIPFKHITVLDWEEENEVDQERIDRYQQAIEQGIDVTTEEFQKGVEDTVNPIDIDHPDTLAWYFFGIGQPRRRDGEEIDVAEDFGTSDG